MMLISATLCLQLCGALVAISVLRLVVLLLSSAFHIYTFLKLVLFLSSVADKNMEKFDTTEAIQCTEIYEFVQKLGKKEFKMQVQMIFWF